MRVGKKISFGQVREAFLRENDLEDKYNRWGLGAIQAAEVQFGSWHRVILSRKDILGIMLPHHTRCGPEIVPPSCATVADAIERLKRTPPDDACRKKVEDLAKKPPTLIFLAAAPIDHPEYGEYRLLVKRNYRGLTHLDGLHRLIAWGLEKRSGVVAYVAGLDWLSRPS